MAARVNLKLGPVGLGTFPFSNVFSRINHATACDVVEQFLALGGRYIETAPVYPQAEVDLKRILARFPRESFLIGTKCAVGRDAEGHSVCSGKPDFIRRQVHAELQRLGVEYIDLLECHLTPTDVPIEEVARVLSELVSEGLVRSVGCSNVNAEQLKRFDVFKNISYVQNRLSVVHRSEGAAISGYCLANDIWLNAYQVIERGQLLTGSRFDELKDNDLRGKKPEYSGEANRIVRNWVRQMDEAFRRDFGVSFDDVPVQWALRQGYVQCCVIGATNIAQVQRYFNSITHPLPEIAFERVELAFGELCKEVKREFGVSFDEFRAAGR